MGFVYNNLWEAFCRTYLELNGFFVTSNLFVDIRNEDNSSPYEADLVAYRPDNTFVSYVTDAPDKAYAFDQREFFAGQQHSLVYCEIKANFSQRSPDKAIAELLEGNGRNSVLNKAGLIAERFNGGKPNGPPPTTVVIGYHISEAYRNKIAAQGWLYKEFQAIRAFVVRRFDAYGYDKLRVMYNDPVLEWMRYDYLRESGNNPIEE